MKAGYLTVKERAGQQPEAGNDGAPAGKILALHTGKVRRIEPAGAAGQWWDKSWETGFYKESRSQPRRLGYQGFDGDEQADRRHHGGPDKAVCVYSAEHYPWWRERLGLPEMAPGAFGENLTAEGVVETEVCIGDRFALGEAEAQVSQPRQPCWKLARAWRVKDLTLQVEQSGFTGFYFRVLRHGSVSAGDGLILLERPFPEWTIARCNEIMHREKEDKAAARALAACPALSASWKDSLWRRAESAAPVESSAGRTGQPD